jgi:hypothetical protein
MSTSDARWVSPLFRSWWLAQEKHFIASGVKALEFFAVQGYTEPAGSRGSERTISSIIARWFFGVINIPHGPDW